MPGDPLQPLSRNQSCWCGSGRKYKLCHGRGPRWPPGAPLPDDPPENGGIWVAPDVALEPEAIEDLTRQMTGAPIWTPSDEPAQRPMIVDSFSAQLARVPAKDPLLSLAQVGMMRNDGIAALGLASEDEHFLRERLSSMSDADHAALVQVVFSSGKETLDHLQAVAAAQQSPTAVWAGDADPRRMAGQTLLWADHYLAEDRVAEDLLRRPEREQAETLARAFAREARLRALLAVGAIALVPQAVISVLTSDVTYAATEGDLDNTELVSWVLSQLMVEGPTAREVAFVTARDHDELGQMYMYGRIDQDEHGRAIEVDEGVFQTSSLVHRYDSQHDYEPWIAQMRRQSAARLLQNFNLDLAIAEAVGGHYVARTPFAGRLLVHKGREPALPQPLVWADIPALPQADAGTLARIAAEDETVHALRRTIRRTFSVAGGQASASAQELALQLAEDADALERTIVREDRWKLAIPASLSAAGIAIGALAGGPLGAAAGALGGLAGLAPIRADTAARRENPAYAVVIARRDAADVATTSRKQEKRGRRARRAR